MVEDTLVRGMHPMVGRRLNLWRLRDFDVTRLEAPEDVLLYHCVATGNEADQRLVALSQVRQLAVVRDETGQVTALPHAERAIANCLEAIRRARGAHGAAGQRLDMNHIWVEIWPVIEADLDQLTALQAKISPLTAGAGIEEVLVTARVAGPDGTPAPIAARFSYQPGSGVVTSIEAPPTERLKPLDDYAQKVVRARRRGLVYPYELVSMVAGPGRHGNGVRPRRQRLAGPRRPALRAQQGRHHRGRRHDSDRGCTPRVSPGCCSAATR